MSVPERIVPDEDEPGIVALHLKRYEFALPHCRGRDVLDAACGVGYGSAHLGSVARRVLAVDRDEEAIAYARRRYTRPNVEFAVADVQELPVADGSFDVVCAFEAIEHLPGPERFVREARRALRPDGVLLISTPRADGDGRASPFHEREFTPGELEQLLRGAFASVELYGQRRLETTRHRLLRRLDVLGLRRRLSFIRRASRLVTGTAATDVLTVEDVSIERGRLDDATELVAVCRP